MFSLSTIKSMNRRAAVTLGGRKLTKKGKPIRTIKEAKAILANRPPPIIAREVFIWQEGSEFECASWRGVLPNGELVNLSGPAEMVERWAKRHSTPGTRVTHLDLVAMRWLTARCNSFDDIIKRQKFLEALFQASQPTTL